MKGNWFTVLDAARQHEDHDEEHERNKTQTLVEVTDFTQESEHERIQLNPATVRDDGSGLTPEADANPGTLNDQGDEVMANAEKPLPDASNSDPNKFQVHLAHVIKMKMQARAIRHEMAVRKAGKRLIWPGSFQNMCWDFGNFTLLVYSVFEIPYALSFFPATCDITWRENFNLFVDCFFLCDCILNFFTAYFDEESGMYVVDLMLIAQHYARGWLVFDVFSSLPLDRILCVAVPTSNSQAYVGFIKAVRLIKVVRFVRMLRLAKKLQDEIGNFASNLLRLLKFVGILLLCAHLCACIWHGVIELNGCVIPASETPSGSTICGCDSGDCQPWNWLVRYDPVLYNEGSLASQYLVSLYYSIVTLTTLGYGDVTPTNNMERALSSALALSGAIMFSFLITSISSLVSKGNSVEVAIEDSITRFSDLCRLKALPRELQERSRKQVAHMIKTAPHLVHDVRYLPRAVRNEVLNHLSFDNVAICPFFKDMDQDCRARLIEVIRPCAFPPGKSIFEAMDIATELYWVVKGEVDIFDVADKMVGRCGPGEMIGIMEMFPENSLFRVGSARARTRCELYELRKEDFLAVVKAHIPDVYRGIRALAAEQIREVNMEELNLSLKAHFTSRCKVLEDIVAKHSSVHRTILKTFGHAKARKLYKLSVHSKVLTGDGGVSLLRASSTHAVDLPPPPGADPPPPAVSALTRPYRASAAVGLLAPGADGSEHEPPRSLQAAPACPPAPSADAVISAVSALPVEAQCVVALPGTVEAGGGGGGAAGGGDAGGLGGELLLERMMQELRRTRGELQGLRDRQARVAEAQALVSQDVADLKAQLGGVSELLADIHGEDGGGGEDDDDDDDEGEVNGCLDMEKILEDL